MAQRTGPSVGFIGLGRMGKPMALNLVAAGFQVVVHSRSPDPVAEVTSAGASAAANPGQVASSANIVCTCLPDEMASEAVYLGEDGLLSTAGPLSLLIETSTIGPALAKRIGEAAKAKGAGYLDAPVSGGVVRAVDASLTIMAGGEADDLERAMPVLQAMGAGIHHVGALGQGSAVKLINQLLVAVHTQAACEAMVLGMRAGADPTQLLEVLSSSGGGGGGEQHACKDRPHGRDRRIRITGTYAARVQGHRPRHGHGRRAWRATTSRRPSSPSNWRSDGGRARGDRHSRARHVVGVSAHRAGVELYLRSAAVTSRPPRSDSTCHSFSGS